MIRIPFKPMEIQTRDGETINGWFGITSQGKRIIWYACKSKNNAPDPKQPIHNISDEELANLLEYYHSDPLKYVTATAYV